MATQDPQTPLLSVTVLNYNYGHYLPTCLNSILAQSFTNFEIILINDKSSDNSLEVIKPYMADPRIRLVDHKENKGFVASLIEGVELSRGKYISVISADDWAVDTRAFEKQIAVLEKDPAVAFVYGAYGHFHDEHSPHGYVWRAANESYVREGRDIFKELVVAPYVLHTGTIIRLSAYRAMGGYDGSLRYAVDTHIILNLCHVGKAAYIDDELYAYRRHMTSMSKSAASIRNTLAEVLKVIDGSFARLPADEQRRLSRLHRHAQQRALIAYAADEVFRGAPREGWRGFWVAVQLRPFQTIFQRTTLILALRALLGDKGYHLLDQVAAIYNVRSRERLAARRIIQQASQQQR